MTLLQKQRKHLAMLPNIIECLLITDFYYYYAVKIQVHVLHIISFSLTQQQFSKKPVSTAERLLSNNRGTPSIEGDDSKPFLAPNVLS